MKRLWTEPDTQLEGCGSYEGDELLAIQGAEVLLGLRNACWSAQLQAMQYREHSDSDADARNPKHSDSASGKCSRSVIKAPRTAYSGTATRSYVWRGPHRGATALRKVEVDNNKAYPPQAQGDAARSDASSSDEEEIVQQGLGQGQKQRDKEWAALTTWLRMNLHHPRTLKKLVLFVGHQEQPNGPWQFELNPGLSWDDVSVETKLRLKMLPEETAQAFAHKYPDRPAGEWTFKVQKYKAPGSSSTVTVPLSDMVYSLRDIYHRYEYGRSSSCSNAQQQGPAAPSGPAVAAAASPSVDAAVAGGSSKLGKTCSTLTAQSLAASCGTVVAAC